MALFLYNLPPTEEGAKLEIAPELEEKCQVVYKLDEEGGALFAGLWDPDNEYSDEFVIAPVRSTFKECRDVEQGVVFANVTGSMKDPKFSGSDNDSWISLYRTKTGLDGRSCCTDGLFYNTRTNQFLPMIKFPDGQSSKYINAACGPGSLRGGVAGGHVALGCTAAGAVAEGGEVAILPICDHHNRGMGVDASGTYVNSWGAGYYMRTGSATKAMILDGYLQPPKLQAALEAAKS